MKAINPIVLNVFNSVIVVVVLVHGLSHATSIQGDRLNNEHRYDNEPGLIRELHRRETRGIQKNEAETMGPMVSRFRRSGFFRSISKAIRHRIKRRTTFELETLKIDYEHFYDSMQNYLNSFPSYLSSHYKHSNVLNNLFDIFSVVPKDSSLLTDIHEVTNLVGRMSKLVFLTGLIVNNSTQFVADPNDVAWTIISKLLKAQHHLVEADLENVKNSSGRDDSHVGEVDSGIGGINSGNDGSTSGDLSSSQLKIAKGISLCYFFKRCS